MEKLTNIQLQSVDLELWFRGSYFAANPDKVAGKVVDTTNKFGKPVKEVRGSMKDALAILPPPSEKENNWLFTSLNQQNSQLQKAPKQESKIRSIERAIKATEEHPTMPTGKGFELSSFAEMRSKYAADISDQEYQLYVQWGKEVGLFNESVIATGGNGWQRYNKPLSQAQIAKLHKEFKAAYDLKTGYMPGAIYYAGDVYEKINDLEQRKSSYVDKIGQEAFDRQLKRLHDVLPTKLRLDAPEAERLHISVIDPFVEKFEVSELANNMTLRDGTSLKWAFARWIDTLDPEEFKNGATAYEVYKYYVLKERMSQDLSKEEKISLKRRASLDGKIMFSRFLSEGLTRQDQQKIEMAWNREYNSFVEIDYSRIPVGFEINKWFGDGLLDPRPTLWQGVRFMSANGSGVIAFDVGVGKTMTSILTLAQAMYAGQCKRPLIVVPNPTYKKWIMECVGKYDEEGNVLFHGILPHFRDRINDYYNLGVDFIDGVRQNPPKDYTITFMTYEGFIKMGMGPNLRDEIGQELFSILEQGLEKRDREKLREKIDERIGDIEGKTVVTLDDMGFDYLVFDEAHNAKKIFTRVKGEVDDSKKGRQASPYEMSSGEPTALGNTLMMTSFYIQKRNQGGNVCLLTATPFTNSPLEIYSMLAVVAYQKLQKRGILNIKDFFDKFVEETDETVINSKGEFQNKAVIKSFNNRKVLQNILFSAMLHKTGEEANVPRPIKVVYPRVRNEEGEILPPELQVDTALRPTPLQKKWIAEISAFASGDSNAIEPLLGRGYYDEDTGRLNARDLMAVTFGQQITLSPYLLKVRSAPGSKEVTYLAGSDPSPAEYVEDSPKIAYTLRCIETIKKWHEARKEPMSGVVVYMNRGTEFFGHVRTYFMQELGLSEKEIEIIDGTTNKNKKERIKEGFLSGKVKVLIGSSTIKEGIDLQIKSTTLFNLTLDWNPTDIQQLEGRIWRQKNQHSHVRIVTPLIEDSVDVFMFQKLEEKTSRINSIWYRASRSNVLDVDKFDPAELKAGLITDPKHKVKNDIEQEVKLKSMRVTNLKKRLELVENSRRYITRHQGFLRDLERWVEPAGAYLDSELDRVEAELANEEISKTNKAIAEARQRRIIGILTDQKTNFDMKLKSVMLYLQDMQKKDYANGYSYSQYSNSLEQIESGLQNMSKNIKRIEEQILKVYNVGLNDDLSPVVERLKEQIVAREDEVKELNSKEEFERRLSVENNKRDELAKQSKGLQERVEQFTIHNHLLSCLRDVHDCTIEDLVIREKAKVIPLESEEAQRIRIVEAEAEALMLLLLLNEESTAA